MVESVHFLKEGQRPVLCIRMRSCERIDPVRGRVTRRDLLLQVADLARGGPRRTRVESEVEQLTFDALDAGAPPPVSGLPEMGAAERVRAELEVLGLDVSHHLVDFYAPMLDSIGVVRSRDLLGCRSKSEVLVAGVKVAVGSDTHGTVAVSGVSRRP